MPKKSTFFVKKYYKKCNISSSYAKILGETNLQPWKFPRSGSKGKDGGKKKKKKRLNDGNKNGQLRIANATSGGARKEKLNLIHKKCKRTWLS